MLDPDEFLPVGVHEGYRKNLTEMFCGKAGIEKIDPASMSRLPNLEVLWLNDNMLSKLQGLDFNFRLKHLYIHNNSITTLCNASCCITKLRHLETLQLQGNQLQDLKATLAVLSQLHNLRKLGLGNNPLALEGSYREATIFAIPSLEHLDSSVVTPIERQAAVKFFTAKRIEKKYAFGTIPRIWDKPAFINIGDPSVGELQLRTEIRASTRRRQAAAEEKQAVELREASRPRFEVSYASGSTGLLSAQAGASTIGEKAFEFVARGRVPHLLVKLGFLTMKSAAKATAVAMDQKAGQGDPEQAKVHVAVSAMGVLKSPLISRDVICAQLEEDDEAAFLRCEEVRRRQRNTHVSVSNRLHPPLEPAPPRIPHLPVLLLPLAHLSLPPYASNSLPSLAPHVASSSSTRSSMRMPTIRCSSCGRWAKPTRST